MLPVRVKDFIHLSVSHTNWVSSTASQPLSRLPRCFSPGCSSSPLRSFLWSQRRFSCAAMTHHAEDNVPSPYPCLTPHLYPIHHCLCPGLQPPQACNAPLKCSALTASDLVDVICPGLKALPFLSKVPPDIRPQLSCHVSTVKPHPPSSASPPGWLCLFQDQDPKLMLPLLELVVESPAERR